MKIKDIMKSNRRKSMTQRSIIFILAIGISLAFGQEATETREFVHYEDMQEYFGNLYQQKKYQEAAEILEKHLDRFPDHLEANAYNLAATYGQLKQYQKGIDALQYVLDRGVWFSIYAFEQEFWAPFKNLAEFKKILLQNDKFWQEAQKSAKPDLLVLAPEGYREGAKYPLFIALHGGNSNIADFKEVWKSERMEQEFVTAYIQSSLIVGMGKYTWTRDLEIAKKEIVEAYHKIIEKYPVDEREIIIGGFSAGGVAALEIMLCNSVPVTGFVVLCPGKPGSFNEENIQEAKKRGIRGTILSTEMDPRLPDQKEMAEVLETLGFPFQFVVTPNIGHWIPEDLDVKIDDAIRHIRQK
jgi:tetratricopeptide (TPR) repeat protein